MTESPSGIVYLVDDDPSFLTSMSRLLRASGYEVRTFTSAEAFLSRLAPDATGCVVADLRMPGQSGLDLQDALAKAGCPMPVVFLTGHGDIPTSVRAMRHGAEDFLTKRAPRNQLLAAVRRALNRGTRENAENLRVRELRDRLDRLTPREREVLELVVQGKMNKQIADELGIHERTVKLHRTSITSKLEVRSVAELTRLVLEANPGKPAPDAS
ncbi:MAG TPA: response regulator [Phycisphaerae bacterium]|nr:response regulator [Phycisphaerae bacterium]